MANNKQIYVSGMINFEADLRVKNYEGHRGILHNDKTTNPSRKQ